MSETIGAVYGAMAKATRALAHVGVDKSSENAAQGFNFRGIDAVLGAMSKVLVESQLVVVPQVITHNTSNMIVNGKPKFMANVVVQYAVTSTVDGSYINARVCAEAIDSQDKSTSKALSMAYKYFAFQTFCIPLEGVLDDGDAGTPMTEEPAQEEAPKARKSRKAAPEAEPAATPAAEALQPTSESQEATELLAALSAVGPTDTDTLATLRAQLLGYRGQAVFADLKAAYKAAQSRIETK